MLHLSLILEVHEQLAFCLIEIFPFFLLLSVTDCWKTTLGDTFCVGMLE